MKTYEETVSEEKFEEVSTTENVVQQGGNRPDFRVVQVENDRTGKAVYTGVGGMWKNISKAGNEFYTLKIGNLKLLVFPNKK
ncbi:hypothetical protein J4450_07770 [Candidatus Micrarchaeota archaeon]|nr:hypothetical protein [Candidatus Micrarchaeota archaeon]